MHGVTGLVRLGTPYPGQHRLDRHVDNSSLCVTALPTFRFLFNLCMYVQVPFERIPRAVFLSLASPEFGLLKIELFAPNSNGFHFLLVSGPERVLMISTRYVTHWHSAELGRAMQQVNASNWVRFR